MAGLVLSQVSLKLVYPCFQLRFVSNLSAKPGLKPVFLDIESCLLRGAERLLLPNFPLKLVDADQQLANLLVKLSL